MKKIWRFLGQSKLMNDSEVTQLLKYKCKHACTRFSVISQESGDISAIFISLHGLCDIYFFKSQLNTIFSSFCESEWFKISYHQLRNIKASIIRSWSGSGLFNHWEDLEKRKLLDFVNFIEIYSVSFHQHCVIWSWSDFSP